jgi:hypothetical protein
MKSKISLGRILIIVIILSIIASTINKIFGKNLWNTSATTTTTTNVSEQFQPYTLKPFGQEYTGSDPLYFYRNDAYRLPYRYPYRFFTQYPYPHLRYNDLYD